MIRTAVTVWLAGLFTAVPYGIWHLLFRAERDRYALLITLILFWIFGYWGVVGPLLAAWRVRSVFRSLDRARTREERLAVLGSRESQDVAIDFIATEHRIPRFLAARVYRLLVKRAAAAGGLKAD